MEGGVWLMLLQANLVCLPLPFFNVVYPLSILSINTNESTPSWFKIIEIQVIISSNVHESTPSWCKSFRSTSPSLIISSCPFPPRPPNQQRFWFPNRCLVVWDVGCGAIMLWWNMGTSNSFLNSSLSSYWHSCLTWAAWSMRLIKSWTSGVVSILYY